MKILITGGAGFIGNNCIRALLNNPTALADKGPIEILNVDSLTYAADAREQATLANDPRYRLAKVDLRDAGAFQAQFAEFRPDAVIHLAAESHVDRSIADPGNFVQTNIIGSFNLLQAARAHYVSLNDPARAAFRVLHVSTDEVYGSLADGGSFSESSPYAPNSPYSASKAAADHLAQAWFATYGLPVITAHASNNFGPFQHAEKLIPKVILNALSGRAIPIYGDGLNTRDWLYVDDCVAALLLALSRGRPGERYNIGAANEWTNLELAKRICGILETLKPRSRGGSYAEQIEFVDDRPGHDFRYAIDASKIRNELGWSPRHAFDAALRSTIQWYLDPDRRRRAPIWSAPSDCG